MGGLVNPILQELGSLSPGAKNALMQAHGAASQPNPMAGTSLPPSPDGQVMGPPTMQRPGPVNPALGAAVKPPSPDAGPPQANTMLPPSQLSSVPSIGGGAQPQVKAPLGSSTGDIAEHARLEQSGPGTNQIQGHPFLKGLAQVGDTIFSRAEPGLASAIPGTTAHHNLLLSQNEKQTGLDLGNEQKQAQTANLESMPQLHQAKQELDQAKLDETQQHHKDQLSQQLHTHGFDQDDDGNIVPLSYDKMSEDQQAVHDLKASQDELAQATTALRKFQADPNNPAAKLAQRRVDGAQQARAIAMQRLGLAEKNFELKSEGTVNGVAPAGALEANDGRPVGTAFQQNVRPTGTQRDAAGRAEVGERIRQRLLTQLQDPAIREQIGPLMGRAKTAEELVGNLPANLAEFGNDLKSYAAFQAGMHPVRGIGGLQYFDKVMGGLGQTPEQMMGKFQSNHNTAQDVIDIGKPKTVGSNGGSSSGPREGDTKVNGDGDKVVYRGGKWQHQP